MFYSKSPLKQSLNRNSLASCKGDFLILLVLSFSLHARYSNAHQAESNGTNHLVIIKGFEFKPNVLTAAKGDTVTWLNKDYAPHNVTISNSQKIITPNLKNNEKFSYTIMSSFDYLCGLHPPMTGRIIVAKKQGTKK